jgi:NDP-sugar pyrophosphorylase family protein
MEQAQTIAEYEGVGTDVLGRWAYPWVPDNSGDEQDSCRFNRGAYVDAAASVAPGSILSKGSLVGRGSTIEAGARLDRCAVGSDCHVGRGAVLQNSCLHSHVRVDDGCQVASALVADHVVVRGHAKLEAGVVLAKRVVIDTAHTVPAGTVVSLVQQSRGGSTGSDEETDWPGAGAPLTASTQSEGQQHMGFV